MAQARSRAAASPLDSGPPDARATLTAALDNVTSLPIRPTFPDDLTNLFG